MTTSERLIAVEDCLSVKGVSLESFYSITIWADKIDLQGKYDSDIVKALHKSYLWGITEQGFTQTRVDVPTEYREPILVVITLT